ncbi:DUF6188 family protein [Nocardia huaxiensis]|uniref:Uncharacterized protein n=1 Tax=Nocardia huaxiensis TaxID=2755382 RepID=A0A7D6Z7R5_9NOCA|nr:DUF6188 family protein [Nocardia huaxiensis]QLY33824.1 hypothetical protein H0264_17700 [Nocardia huaxiensis]UFS99249.1 DUF6188 family protein [Nocardia huaxiensis]
MELPIIGEHLTVRSSDPLLIIEAGEYELHIEGELAVHDPSAQTLHRIPGEPHTDELVQALDGEITYAAATSDGQLRIDLDSGQRLVVEPDRFFEAWTVTAPGRYLVVCMPGGELAVWSQES